MTSPPPSGLELFGFSSKDDFMAQTAAVWNPDKVRFWRDAGTDLVIDRREEYFLFDTSGKRLIDLHLNGGTYNLGHRNPELIEALEWAMRIVDIGNHHFPALARTALATALLDTCHAGMKKVVYAAGGSEAVDIAIKSATETEYHLISARDFALLDLDQWHRLTAETVEIRKMLYAYRRKLLA